MTDNPLRGDLKFSGAIATAIVGALVVFAYMVRRMQFNLYGLPPDMDISQLSYANTVAQLLVKMAIDGALICSPLLGLAWLLARVCRRREERTAGPSGMAICFVSIVSVFVLLIPAVFLSSLQGLLWLTGKPDSIKAGMLHLVLGDANGAKFTAGGLALGAMVLVLLYVVNAVADWRRRGGPGRLGKAVALGLITILALSAYAILLAGVIPGLGDSAPLVTVTLRSSAISGGATVDGLLISQTTSFVSILPVEAGSARVVLLPKDSIARIDCRVQGEQMKRLLYQRLEGDMEKSVEISKRLFTVWAVIGALLVAVGFSLLMPVPARAATSGGADLQQDSSVPGGNARTGRVAGATLLSPDLLASVLAYFPAVATTGSEVFNMLNTFVGMIGRGDHEAAADLWLHEVDGSQRRLTTDGDYVSPRPSRDGSRVAFLRQGSLGILDVATGSVRLLPGEITYSRLYGWDESTGTLLVARNDNVLVRLYITDGHTETLMGPSPTGDDLAELEALARMTPSPGMLLVRDYGGEWVVLEKRWGEAENVKHFTSKHPIADPAWCKAGIVYVGAQD